MKRIVPNYYSQFSCLMGTCKHNCCIGWEIDIDEDSLLKYRSVPGKFGEKLKYSIEYSGDVACFRLTSEERCPFLQKNGLCEMILCLGSDSLCHICADHPRFRNFFSDRTEIGLGLCCEAAGRLILSHKEPVHFIESTAKDAEQEEPLSAEEKIS